MENPSRDDKSNSSEGRSTLRRPVPNWWLFLILAAMMSFLLMSRFMPKRAEIRYSFFLEPTTIRMSGAINPYP